MTIRELLSILNDAGVLGLLVAVLVGGARQWWVWGWAYRDVLKTVEKLEGERDEWRDLALQGTSLAEKTVDLARRR